jgi:GNAT superfamily N-acetyltransferase
MIFLRTVVQRLASMGTYCFDYGGCRAAPRHRNGWVQLVQRHSLGWVVARDGADLVGFVNVLWDGLVHAWLQDTMVAVAARGRGIGTGLVDRARHGAKAAGCEYLHVDFEDHLAAFYYGACGFRPTSAGLLELN